MADRPRLKCCADALLSVAALLALLAVGTNAVAFIYEWIVEPNDLHLLGLLAAVTVKYGLPLGLVLGLIGATLRLIGYRAD